MRGARFLMALGLVAVLAAPAAAQNPNFKFLSGTPYSPQPVLQVGSHYYYVSPYRGQFLSIPGQPMVDIFCVDFGHSVSTGQTWTAAFTTLDGSSMANTYGVRFRHWSDGLALQRYKGAAFLASQFGTLGKSQWPNLQAAIWSLMGQDVDGTSTTFPLGLPDADDATGLNLVQEGWFNAAVDGGASPAFDGSRWTVISDVRESSLATQEFIANVVPEPQVIILLASGLLAIGAMAYFRGVTTA
jgi:hypothetical protein